MSRPRYYFTRISSRGKYLVRDRQLDETIIAECMYREQAALVVTALNLQEQERSNVRVVQTSVVNVAPWDEREIGA